MSDSRGSTLTTAPSQPLAAGALWEPGSAERRFKMLLVTDLCSAPPRLEASPVLRQKAAVSRVSSGWEQVDVERG